MHLMCGRISHTQPVSDNQWLFISSALLLLTAASIAIFSRYIHGNCYHLANRMRRLFPPPHCTRLLFQLIPMQSKFLLQELTSISMLSSILLIIMGQFSFVSISFCPRLDHSRVVSMNTALQLILTLRLQPLSTICKSSASGHFNFFVSCPRAFFFTAFSFTVCFPFSRVPLV